MGEPQGAGAAASPGEESPVERSAVILTPDQRVRVFISSTLGELAAERAAARRAITRLHLVPVWYESGLAAGKPMLLYLKRPAPDLEPRLAAMIESIRAAGTVSYRTFTTPRELERLLADDLAVLLSESFAGAAASGAEADLPAGTVTFLLTDI